MAFDKRTIDACAPGRVCSRDWRTIARTSVEDCWNDGRRARLQRQSNAFAGKAGFIKHAFCETNPIFFDNILDVTIVFKKGCDENA
jgi:hypothetical protein